MSTCGIATNVITDCNNEQVCSPYSLSTDPVNCLVQQLVEEHLNISAAPINVFKLLGVHEQGKLVDLTGKGTAISSGQYPDYPASNAFNNDFQEWRSTQKGSLVTTSGYIGYDFGPIKLDNSRLEYSVDTKIQHHITTIKIQQACEAKNRVTKARVERSDDGQVWLGVAIVILPNTTNLETISFKQSASSRYWRLRPITFLGGDIDFWAVKQLELIDFAATRLDNIQDELGFLENRDRAYASEGLAMKGYYDLLEPSTDLTRFGIDMSSSQQFIFQIAFSASVRILGRPIVIGDIFEIPSEAQYAPDMTKVKKYVEVTDVMWSNTGFSPGWVPTIQRVVTMPMLASQETLDIIGDINPPSSLNEFFGMEQSPFNVEALTANAKIEAEARRAVPERGAEDAKIRQFTEEEISRAATKGVDLTKLNVNQRGVYNEDGMPPNGLPYTEGITWPENPKDGDYHRLTYEARLNIPTRLHKYSIMKNRWVFVEEDKRSAYNIGKPTLNSLLRDSNRVNNNEIA